MNDPWRYGTQGLSLAVKVVPRGGRDAVDGVETLANGHAVLRVRVRAIAEGGAANRAVCDLLSQTLKISKSDVRLLAGATSRQKRIALDGDPVKLADLLRRAIAIATPVKEATP